MGSGRLQCNVVCGSRLLSLFSTLGLHAIKCAIKAKLSAAGAPSHFVFIGTQLSAEVGL